MSEPMPPVETQRADTKPANATGEPGWAEVLAYPLATLAAAIGAALGAVVVSGAWQSGFYALPAVGLLAGWGASLVSKKASWSIGAIAGVIALAVGVFAQWKFCNHFIADPSFGYFIAHLFDLPKFDLLLHAVNIALAVWLGSRK